MGRVISVLGVKYKINLKVDPSKDLGLEGRDGYCDYLNKTIVVADTTKSNEWKDEPISVIDEYEKVVLRHEIIHAFLFESGLWGSSGSVSSWATNEEMVDWIALQFPKILDVFQKMDCI